MTFTFRVSCYGCPDYPFIFPFVFVVEFGLEQRLQWMAVLHQRTDNLLQNGFIECAMK